MPGRSAHRPHGTVTACSSNCIRGRPEIAVLPTILSPLLRIPQYVVQAKWVRRIGTDWHSVLRVIATAAAPIDYNNAAIDLRRSLVVGYRIAVRAFGVISSDPVSPPPCRFAPGPCRIFPFDLIREAIRPSGRGFRQVVAQLLVEPTHISVCVAPCYVSKGRSGLNCESVLSESGRAGHDR